MTHDRLVLRRVFSTAALGAALMLIPNGGRGQENEPMRQEQAPGWIESSAPTADAAARAHDRIDAAEAWEERYENRAQALLDALLDEAQVFVTARSGTVTTHRESTTYDPDLAVVTEREERREQETTRAEPDPKQTGEAASPEPATATTQGNVAGERTLVESRSKMAPSVVRLIEHHDAGVPTAVSVVVVVSAAELARYADRGQAPDEWLHELLVWYLGVPAEQVRVVTRAD